MPSQRAAIVVWEAFNLSVFRGIDLLDQFLFLKTPGILALGEAVLDAALAADPIEDVVESVFVTGLVGEPDTVAGQRRVDDAGTCCDEIILPALRWS